jgi:hypothetical protein
MSGDGHHVHHDHQRIVALEKSHAMLVDIVRSMDRVINDHAAAIQRLDIAGCVYYYTRCNSKQLAARSVTKKKTNDKHMAGFTQDVCRCLTRVLLKKCATAAATCSSSSTVGEVQVLLNGDDDRGYVLVTGIDAATAVRGYYELVLFLPGGMADEKKNKNKHNHGKKVKVVLEDFELLHHKDLAIMREDIRSSSAVYNAAFRWDGDSGAFVNAPPRDHDRLPCSVHVPYPLSSSSRRYRSHMAVHHDDTKKSGKKYPWWRRLLRSQCCCASRNAVHADPSTCGSSSSGCSNNNNGCNDQSIFPHVYYTQ